ncbi:hypothetical protein GC163_17910 [bacterium]|nr:hypothetical protein [bacterium]
MSDVDPAKLPSSRTNECSRRSILKRTAAGSAIVWSQWANQARPQAVAGADVPDLPPHVTLETMRAIERGLVWLSAQQQFDGGFGQGRSYTRNVGVCALCGLAFLASGRSGSLAQAVRRCTDYLLAHALPSGFIVEEDVVTHAPLYGHGFATLFLGQIYGMDARPAVREALKQAVQYIIAAQNPSGGWRYTDDPNDADVSITTCQMMALVSAHQAGIAVPQHIMEHSAAFVRRCQNPDGGFRYRPLDPPDSLFPRSAAAVVALYAVGGHTEPAVLRGRDYLSQPSTTRAPQHAEYYYYGRFYATHAAWQAGGDTWDDWYPRLREELLARQSEAGFWDDPCIGNEYATAMALTMLQFPLDSVPLFLR